MSDFALFQRLFAAWGIILLLWYLGPTYVLLSPLGLETGREAAAPIVAVVIIAIYAVAHIMAILLTIRWTGQYRRSRMR